MSRTLLLLAGATLALRPVGADAQTAESIFSEAASRQAERWETVQNYAIEELLEGAPASTPSYFVRDDEVLDEVAFRRVPASEWGGGDEDDAPVGPEMPFNLDIENMMYRGDPDGSDAEGMAALAERAQLVGVETVDGRPAFHLRADDLSDIEIGETDDEADVTLRAASMWFDSEEFVPLRTRMELEVESEGGTAPMEVEMRMEGYERVGPLYEPTRQVVRMTGIQAMMGAGQDEEEREETQRELAEARAQLAEMQEQMDQVPEAMRGMMQGQLDRYLEMIETMEGEGAIETVIRRRVIAVNEGPPTDWSPTLGPEGVR